MGKRSSYFETWGKRLMARHQIFNLFTSKQIQMKNLCDFDLKHAYLPTSYFEVRCISHPLPPPFFIPFQNDLYVLDHWEA